MCVAEKAKGMTTVPPPCAQALFTLSRPHSEARQIWDCVHQKQRAVTCWQSLVLPTTQAEEGGGGVAGGERPCCQVDSVRETNQ